MHHAFTRTLGVATAAYGVATIVKPDVLARPTQLDTTTGEASWQLQTLIRAIGVRDVASGVAIAVSPPGRTLQTALLLRIAADIGDATVFGIALPARDARRKSVGGAGAWAALNLTALIGMRRNLRGGS